MSGSDRRHRSSVTEVGAVCLCILLAVVLTFFVGEWFGMDAGRNQVETTSDYNDAKEQALLACRQRDRSALIECVADTVKASQDQKNSRQDLYAQEAMARWTAVMAGSAILGFGVAVLGVYYLRETLIRTADAAEAANNTNEIMRAEQRPWLEILTKDRQICQTLGTTVLAQDQKPWELAST